MILPLTVLCIATTQAQNLVPNPSFEEYYDCPINFGQWAEVVDWTSPYNTSADYFNTCAGTGYAGVPLSSQGYQYPAQGSAYMGVIAFAQGAPSYREFIATHLTEPLQAGVPVYLCFKLALGGFGSVPPNSGNYTCSGMGLKFFNELPADWNGWYSYLQPEYPNSAAIHLEEAFTDTSDWVTVSGTYTPDSAYTQLVIGNFFSDSLSQPIVFDAGYGTSNTAYFFIDQVSVSYDPNYCANWSGVQDIMKPIISIGPNPFGATLRLTSPNTEAQPLVLQILDATGRTVLREEWPKECNELNIDGSTLLLGYYTLLVTNAQGATRSYALVHVSP
ncbi:MAG: hypothetical protein IPF78_01290 [Flavobacteriales bacterium]|nr:hypothetical protein [Flavobacteriales bacterium]